MTGDFSDKTTSKYIFQKYWNEVRESILKPLAEPVVKALLGLSLIIFILFGVFSAGYDAWQDGSSFQEFLGEIFGLCLKGLYGLYGLVVAPIALFSYIPIKEYYSYRIRSDLLVMLISGFLALIALMLAISPFMILEAVMGVNLIEE